MFLLSLLAASLYGEVSVKETAVGGDPNFVDIDNQAYNNYAISRVGSSEAQTVPKRLENTLKLKLTDAGGTQDMLQLHVGDKIIPETAFEGFSGTYGLGVKLVITDPASAPTSGTAPAGTKTNAPAGTTPASGSSILGGGYGGGIGGYGAGGYPGGMRSNPVGSPNTSSYTDGHDSMSAASRIMGTNKPSKKLTFPGASGVHVKVETPDTKITPPEPPALQVNKPAVVPHPAVETSPDVAEEAIESKKRKNIVSIVLWSLVSAALLGVVIFKRLTSKPRAAK
jgi:hypothetical protein